MGVEAFGGGEEMFAEDALDAGVRGRHGGGKGGGVEVGGVVMEEERRWRGEEERRRVVVGEGGLPGRGEDNGIEDKG